MQTMQLTLQSNLRSRSFMAVYLLAVMVAMVLGGVQVLGSVKFSLFNRYQVMTDEAVEHGMLSAHYESMRSAHDQLLPYPMIPSDTISGSRLRVFIPHRPQRDNPLARQHCTALPPARNEATGAKAASAAVECLSRLWRVQLDGTPVDLHDFMPMERRDLDMRGLVGYLPMATLAPGRHDLSLVWNAEGASAARSDAASTASRSGTRPTPEKGAEGIEPHPRPCRLRLNPLRPFFFEEEAPGGEAAVEQQQDGE